MNKREWSKALQLFLQSQYVSNPIPDLKNLSDEEKWQYRIIGGGLVNWLNNIFPDISQERMAVFMSECDSDPLVVLTSTMAGLIAVQEITKDSDDSIIYLFHTDFEKWEEQHPVDEDELPFLIHHWSYFCEIDQELLIRAKEAYPSINVEEFRIHREGHLWGPRCGRFWDHLWKWNGGEMELLEQEFSQGLY